MQLPPGRSLLDGRCVKDTSPAALDCMAKWTVVYTSFLWFCSTSYDATCALACVGADE